ncbi:NOP5/NOP56 family protein [Halobacteriales archaeon Cl-PHB]
MTERDDLAEAWFAGLDPDDGEAASRAVSTGETTAPRDWPRLAVTAGFADSPEEYYDRLGEATRAAARRELRERERSDDQQLIHAVRAMDDCRRTANELAERLSEWAGSRESDGGTGVDYARRVAARDPEDPVDRRVVELAQRVVDLDDEAAALQQFIERTLPEVAPNLAALAGPVLAARLLSHAGGLESLARKPSGTVQLLGAEDALFAHLQGGAPSPKHGVIFTHDAVRGTSPDNRGSAARALAGKLSIAARVDHYSGDYRPEVEADLEERIRTIQERDAQ